MVDPHDAEIAASEIRINLVNAYTALRDARMQLQILVDRWPVGGAPQDVVIAEKMAQAALEGAKQAGQRLVEVDFEEELKVAKPPWRTKGE